MAVMFLFFLTCVINAGHTIILKERREEVNCLCTEKGEVCADSETRVTLFCRVCIT